MNRTATHIHTYTLFSLSLVFVSSFSLADKLTFITLSLSLGHSVNKLTLHYFLNHHFYYDYFLSQSNKGANVILKNKIKIIIIGANVRIL